jgi:DNA-binding XRE family transcriptional regulator
MSEQSSEVSAKPIGANRYSDNDMDKLSRTNLFRNLERMRVLAELSQAQVSTTAGRNPDWLKELGVTDSYYWKYNDVHDWARALNIAIRFNTVGVAVLPEARIPTLMRVAEGNPAFTGVAMLEYLGALRDYLGYEQKYVAQRMGVNHGTMYAIQNSDNPRLSTLQRYARALGGALMFEGQRYPIRDTEKREPF